jgi:hypothetical protein
MLAQSLDDSAQGYQSYIVISAANVMICFIRAFKFMTVSIDSIDNIDSYAHSQSLCSCSECLRAIPGQG